jgi:hypothetical protein
MPTKPSSFKKTDVARAIAAVLTAGLGVARVEVDASGKIVVVPGKPGNDETTLNPWDRHEDEKRPS